MYEDEVENAEINYAELRTMGDSDVRVLELHETTCQDRAVLISFAAFCLFVWVAVLKVQAGV